MTTVEPSNPEGTARDDPQSPDATGPDRRRLIAWGQELRAVHGYLRASLQIAREAIEDGTGAEALARNLDLTCWGFCAALTGHHTGEDANLFPLVLNRFPDLRPIVDKLVQDHNMLTQLVGDLERTLTGGTDHELVRHLDGIEAFLAAGGQLNALL